MHIIDIVCNMVICPDIKDLVRVCGVGKSIVRHQWVSTWGCQKIREPIGVGGGICPGYGWIKSKGFNYYGNIPFPQ